MVSATPNQRRCLPVHTISATRGNSTCQKIIGFYALTRGDAISFFSFAIGKERQMLHCPLCYDQGA